MNDDQLKGNMQSAIRSVLVKYSGERIRDGYRMNDMIDDIIKEVIAEPSGWAFKEYIRRSE